MGLRIYIIRRLLLLIPILIGAPILIFSIREMFDPMARFPFPIEPLPSGIEEIIAKYGLNDPSYLRFLHWLQQILSGDLGFSRTARQPVVQAILTRLPVTAEVVLISASLVIIIGMYLDVKSATNKDRMTDPIIRTITTVSDSLPSFWLSILLIVMFSVVLHIIPVQLSSNSGLTPTSSAGTSFVKFTGMNTIDGLLNGRPDITLNQLGRLVLPVTVLVTISLALITGTMRSNILNALNKGYILAARAKGLTQNEVIKKLVRRNALIPTIKLLGLIVAGMLNAVVITETVFGLDGLGRWAANAAVSLDIDAVVGFTIFSCIILVLTNLTADILHAYLEPRLG